MPLTTKELAAEMQVSERQVLNYKDAVEAHIGKVITYRQGKQHYYRDQYLPLIRMYANNEPLPEIQEETAIQPVNPFDANDNGEERGSGRISSLVLRSEVLPAPMPLEEVEVCIRTVDVTAFEVATDRNFGLTDKFKTHIEHQVLADATAFGRELAAKVKHVVSKEVAQAYREVIR